VLIEEGGIAGDTGSRRQLEEDASRHPPVYQAKSFALGIDEGTPILFNSLLVFRLTAWAVALTIRAIAVGP
jgi:hypothetical protein